jgi:outer membrane protein assembly factor BamB
MPDLKPAAGLSFLILALALPASPEDWTEWRGPARNGTSSERGLPARWSPAGENLAWRAPYGARSTPVVLGDRLYLLDASTDPIKEREKVQERLLCLNADSGALIWERVFPVFHTDVPTHRVAWASPSVDPATGDVYVFGVHGLLSALSPEGKLLWERSLTEEFGAITTHGGRTVSPVIEGDLVVVSTLTAGWGDQARGNNRYFAFDKLTGETVWVASPQPRHYDTNYSTPAVATVAGTRLLVVGGSDGAIHALKAATGESVWSYEMSKRAILTSVVVDGTTVYVTHSEENLDTSEMGQIAALDAALEGKVRPAQAKWRTVGFQGGFSSPVIDGQRLYEVDNGAVLGAFDLKTGGKLWERPMGTIQKASLVLADGKLFLGTENGKFYILRPGPAGVEILDEDLLGTEAEPEAIIASPAVARGRVYLASMSGLYAIGPKAAPRAAPARRKAPPPSEPPGEPTVVRLRPYEVLLRPGETVAFRARLYDARGRFVREEAGATWSLEGLRGDVNAGRYTAAAEATPQAGLVKASVGTLAGTARVRVLPPLPWSHDFEDAAGEAPPPFWINSTGKFAVLPKGGKALAKLPNPPLTRRGRLFMGPPGWSDYTVQADVLATEKRRQMGDGGVIAQRYALVLLGNNQRLELHPWQANPARTVATPFSWTPETWYRVKLRVESLADGTAHVQGKAWPAADPEPAAWIIDFKDALPHHKGAPGLYADAPSEVFFDNVKVTANK